VTARWWNDDEGLLGALDDAVRSARDVPDRFVEAGKASYAWHGIDAELARLTYDSATMEPAGAVATTRAEAASLRAMTYAAKELVIELEVTDDALLGQLVPPQAGEVELRSSDGTTSTVPVDEVGWFSFRPIPAGTFRLSCRPADGRDVTTDWIAL
jgi:hypothetical protein